VLEFLTFRVFLSSTQSDVEEHPKPYQNNQYQVISFDFWYQIGYFEFKHEIFDFFHSPKLQFNSNAKNSFKLLKDVFQKD
jgi:hypothetical protein